MCILCGELIMHVHWTDQPAHDASAGRTVVAGEGQRDRMRLRIKRTALSNKILRYYGLSLRDWCGSRYLLADKKGNTRIVYDLGDMWQQASELAHRKLDPLDEAFLSAFGQKEETRHGAG